MPVQKPIANQTLFFGFNIIGIYVQKLIRCLSGKIHIIIYPHADNRSLKVSLKNMLFVKLIYYSLNETMVKLKWKALLTPDPQIISCFMLLNLKMPKITHFFIKNKYFSTHYRSKNHILKPKQYYMTL
jgi:hypothetical protein